MVSEVEVSEHYRRVEAHYRGVWGPRYRPIRFERGPVGDLPAAFRVLEFEPRKDRHMWSYATCCMSQPRDEEPLELHLFAGAQRPELVELLVATAHFHRTGGRLGLGHTVNFGRPWVAASSCDHGLISLPYLDGPSLEKLSLADGSIVRFLWLLPITKSELEFKKRFGVEALETRFEASGFDYVDPQRPPVV